MENKRLTYKERLETRKAAHIAKIRKNKVFRPKPKMTAKPLEEHFEDFTGTLESVGENIVENAQDFLGLGKKAAKRRAARNEVKNKKKLAKTDLIQSKADANRIAAQGAADAEKIRAQAEADAARAAAAPQTAQVNQLAQATGNSPAYPEQTPMYQTLQENKPMNTGNWADDKEEQQQQQQQPVKPVKKSKNMIYIAVAVVVIIGIVYMIKRKK